MASLDGTIHCIDTKSGKRLWSFSSGRPIYSSYQHSLNVNESEFYVDVGEDWQLYIHNTRLGKTVSQAICIFLGILKIVCICKFIKYIFIFYCRQNCL